MPRTDGRRRWVQGMAMTGWVFAIFAAAAHPGAAWQRPERVVKVPGLDLALRDGWQVVFHEGCRFAVPVAWRSDEDGTLAAAPDGSTISIRMFTITNWATHKAQIRSTVGRVTSVHEDTDRRLWLEIGGVPRVRHYIDVLNGLTVCSALLEIRAAVTADADDTIRRIAESVGPAPDRWPPDDFR